MNLPPATTSGTGLHLQPTDVRDGSLRQSPNHVVHGNKTADLERAGHGLAVRRHLRWRGCQELIGLVGRL